MSERVLQEQSRAEKVDAMISFNIRDRRSAAGSYDFREENGMWTVYNCQSGYAAVLNGVPQVGLGSE
jgi:ABC-type transporter MlaC component